MEQTVGLGNPSDVWRCGIGLGSLHLSLSGCAGRGRGTNTTTFQQQGDEESDKGVWMSVLRHPDGHVFRVGRGVEAKK